MGFVVKPQKGATKCKKLEIWGPGILLIID
jgi:hypothetical protein